MSDQVCVLILGEGDEDFGLVGVTDMPAAEEWRKADSKHRSYEIFDMGKILEAPEMADGIAVLDEFVPAEDCEPVRVTISGGDEWDRQKAEQLIRSSHRMYDALHEVAQFFANCPNDHSDANFDAMLLGIDRAIAMAIGGVLQSDRALVIGGSDGKARTGRNHRPNGQRR